MPQEVRVYAAIWQPVQRLMKSKTKAENMILNMIVPIHNTHKQQDACRDAGVLLFILMSQLSLEDICLSFCLVSRQKSCASILRDLIGTSIVRAGQDPVLFSPLLHNKRTALTAESAVKAVPFITEFQPRRPVETARSSNFWNSLP